jgi:hypothetical protein
MKGNIDIIAGLTAIIGAFLRALKRKFTKKETIINLFIAGILAFGVIGFLEMLLPRFVNDVRILLLISFFVGWLTHDLTDRIEKLISDIYDLFIDYLKIKFNKKNGSNETDKN